MDFFLAFDQVVQSINVHLKAVGRYFSYSKCFPALLIVPRSSRGGNRCRVSMAAVRFFFSMGVSMQVFPVCGACWFRWWCFREAAFVYAGCWPRLIVTTAVTGRMVPRCGCVGVLEYPQMCWAEVIKGSLISAVVNARGCVRLCWLWAPNLFVAISGTPPFLSRIAKILTEVAMFSIPGISPSPGESSVKRGRKFHLWPMCKL